MFDKVMVLRFAGLDEFIGYRLYFNQPHETLYAGLVDPDGTLWFYLCRATGNKKGYEVNQLDLMEMVLTQEDFLKIKIGSCI